MSAGPTRWGIAGGGTGGHVTPALALAEGIRARGEAVRILGSRRGLEARLVPEAGFELVALPARPLAGLGARGHLALPALARGCAAAWLELGRFDPDVVISVGGYAAVPAVVACALRRIPLALVEPNAVPGRTNLLSARFARRIFLQFDGAADAFARHGARASVTGIPLRRSLLEAFAHPEPRREPAPPLRLLVFGGSQGARQINEVMIQAAPLLDSTPLQLFHQTGEADRPRVAEAYARAGLPAEVVAFEPDMPSRYRWADLALCRAGALTVAELALAGLPALLVPYPFAADDHQAANAQVLADAGAARVLDPRALSAEQVAGCLTELAGARGTLRAMGEAAAKRARPHATEHILEACAALARGAG